MAMNGHEIFPNGDQCWRLDGALHRTDGPAVIYSDGSQEWFQHGKRHRTDGPALIGKYGHQEWWMRDQSVTHQMLAWMNSKGVTWPWDEEVQMEFLLTWL